MLIHVDHLSKSFDYYKKELGLKNSFKNLFSREKLTKIAVNDLVLAVILNFLIFYCFSAIAFWLVEIGFLFEGIRIVTILLSGGIFPLEVFGSLFGQVSNFLPFRYTVHYPIHVLNGTISTEETIQGVVMQCLWIAASLLLAQWLWRIGSRRYVAVGG
jgi:ABC-2 type transport system permease protein